MNYGRLILSASSTNFSVFQGAVRQNDPRESQGNRGRGVASLTCLLAALWAPQALAEPPGSYCRPFPRERVQATPGGFLLLDRQGRHDGRVVPRADEPSPNSQFWICQRAGEPVGLVLAPPIRKATYAGRLDLAAVQSYVPLGVPS
jgi:hypothetical protein